MPDELKEKMDELNKILADNTTKDVENDTPNPFDIMDSAPLGPSVSPEELNKIDFITNEFMDLVKDEYIAGRIEHTLVLKALDLIDLIATKYGLGI